MPRSLHFALAPVLVTQALWARQRTPRLPEADGEREGEVGDTGDVVRLLMVGDSSAAGVGVATQAQALAGHLTRTLWALGRRVKWRLVARSGVTSAQALDLLRAAAPLVADIAVVTLGVNDVVDRVPVPAAITARAALADWLIDEAGVRHVAFAALPPVHQFPALPQPLRAFAGAEARRHDEALAAWAVVHRAGHVAHVPMGVSLDRSVMAVDGFHPAEPVYRQCAEVLARHVHAVLGEPVRPVAEAAARALGAAAPQAAEGEAVLAAAEPVVPPGAPPRSA